MKTNQPWTWKPSQTWKASLVSLMLLLGSGCGALPFIGTGAPPPMQTVQMDLEGQPEMNSGGNAAVVRIYQLSGTTNFTRTPLTSFWKNDETALGSELVSMKEVLVYPEEKTPVAIEIRDRTTHVGVAADLRTPDREGWRTLYPVGALEEKDMTTTVTTDRIQVDLR